MKILSIPILIHDSSLCVLENGKIFSYKMEERFSRQKHDMNFSNILEIISREKYEYFDKVIII